MFAAPERDRYQLISEHKPGHVIAEDTGLGIKRTDDLVILQITQQGRNLDQKRALYATLAERLEAECGLAPSDLIVSLTENTKEDWSFGNGVAQFVEGQL
ncbi:tautomerase family protein [Aeromicrobium sp. REDSEA-S32_B7]|uniref:tautomerase family protein n=1 Tax=Aeromicrobium sp. REDSEA-S32_B7 TaxID=1811526 RepID=UPI000B09BC4B|nr:tautomerase family protein [Aeromicrobium sp. REDSEA-S32_B7]